MSTEKRLVFAGMLPYSFDIYGTLRLLLARERFGRDVGSWSGFAGKPEESDSSVFETASREAHEESCGLLGTADFLEHLALTVCLRLDVERGVHFLLPFQFVSYLPHTFAGVQEAFRRATGIKHGEYSPLLEKSEIRWFTMEELASVPLRPKFRADLHAVQNAISKRYGRSMGASGTMSA